jgi:DNA processing protein
MASIVDRLYPENLKAAYNRPPFVFIKGTLEGEDQQALAIVGSRQASSKAQSVAAELAASFVERGMTIVSGLAEGIDAAAHRGALGAAGRTIGVMGTGIDLVHPSSHESLANEIAGQGCLMSQFRPGSPPTKSTFPIRNAVISGMTLGSLLVEAQDRSGTLSEAAHARRQGRPVFLWGPLLNGDEWGIRWREKRGVHVVDDVEHVVSVLQSEATWSTPFTLG